jgi:hypothetical protein
MTAQGTWPEQRDIHQHRDPTRVIPTQVIALRRSPPPPLSRHPTGQP